MRAVRIGAVLVLLLGLAAAGGTWWWTQRDAPATVAEASYMTPNLAPYVASVPAPGTLRAVRAIEVRSDVAGAVEWTAALGTRVSLGDVVARLDASNLVRDLRDAELTLERSERALTAARSDILDTDRSLANALLEAERRLARAQLAHDEASARLDLNERLAAVGGASARDLSDARAALAAASDEAIAAERAVALAQADILARQARQERDLLDAEAAVEAAQMRVARAETAFAAATITTPIAGVISDVRVAAGGFVGSNATVLTISDDHTLELVAQVDESEIGQIAVGQTASISVMALGDRRFASEVAAVAPVARTNQNIPVFEVVLPVDNSEGLLRVGMTADASIVTRRVDGTLTLPASAVTLNPRGEGMVSVRDEAGETSRVPVEVIAAAGSSLVVRGEFEPGSEIELPPAVAAAVVPASPAPAPAPSAGILPALAHPTGSPTGGSSGGGAGAGRTGGGQ